MKVYISGYRNHWVSPYTILEKVLFWKKDIYEKKPPKWLQTLCEWNTKVLDTIHPRIEYVKIDNYDVWSLDTTMSLILLPMFKQLKATKHGAPYTQDEDVPDHLKSMNVPRVEDEYDADDNHFLRWDYILDEIIWTLSQSNIDWEDQYKSGVSDFKFVKLENGNSEMVKGPNDTREYDWEGMKLHQERMTNGFRLMGCYWQGFWT